MIQSKPNHKAVSKAEAIRRLRSAGHSREAEELEAWRDINGNNWGWDGFVRREWPDLVDVIWPT